MASVRMLLAVSLALVFSASAEAQFRDATAKMRGDVGVLNSAAREGYRYYSNDVAPAAPAQAATATAPRQERSYSVEPRTQTARPEAARAEAARPRTTRSYSYEPSTTTYRAPSRGWRTPTYLLPKTDPRRF